MHKELQIRQKKMAFYLFNCEIRTNERTGTFDAPNKAIKNSQFLRIYNTWNKPAKKFQLTYEKIVFSNFYKKDDDL